MVNGLHLYSAFPDPMATKVLYIFASHSPIHTQPAATNLLVCRQSTWTTAA